MAESQKQVLIPSQDLSLESVVHIPEGDGPFPGVVMCHPHPEYGGSMLDAVVVSVCQELVRKSIIALRFNFRGVGMSGGEFANGLGERDDVIVALAFLSSFDTVDRSRIGLSGYSFGAVVSLMAGIQTSEVKALALVSPPVSFFPFGIEQLSKYPKPKFVICGTADPFVPYQELQHSLKPEELEVIDGADHFWSSEYRKVGDSISSFFHTVL
ncbi:MAG: alpha/beta hydrolase [Chloroflexota bacterium]|nr:alpha/beta hydrolase [Chloroflexota bacterium]